MEETCCKKKKLSINAGLDKVAKIYIDKKSDKKFLPIVYDRTGSNKSINLHTYKLIDGTEAKEFVQMIAENELGQLVHFLALTTSKKKFTWPAEKIQNHVDKII